MNRRQEYEQLCRALEQTPPALEGTVERARERARKKRLIRRFQGSAAGLAGVFAAFVLLVNLSMPFALACGRIPLLRELAAAVAFSPSLKAAVEHDYVQLIQQTREENGVSLTVEYVIVDQKQVNIFYTTHSEIYPGFLAYAELQGADGARLEGYAVSSGGATQNGELGVVVVDFIQQSVPDALEVTFRLIPSLRDSQSEPRPVGEPVEEPPEPEPVVQLTFLLRFDPEYTSSGRTVEVGKWVTLDGQRIFIKNVEIYPTHVRLNLEDHPDNTAWLQSLEFYLEDEKGVRYEKIGNGISATGSQDSRFMAGHRLESSYFGRGGRLTLHITAVSWLEKEMEYTRVDLKQHTAFPLPEGIRLERVEPLAEGSYQLVFSAPVSGEGGYGQITRWDYLDETGQERGMEDKSMTGDPRDQDRFEERFTLRDYPYDTVYIGLSVTRRTRLETPLVLPLY